MITRLRTVLTVAELLWLLLFTSRLLTTVTFPRVNVRWTPGLHERAREYAERALHLRNGRRLDADAWSYEIEGSTANVRALIAHPAVADTHHVDRGADRIAADAPPGETASWWADRISGRRGSGIVYRLEQGALVVALCCLAVWHGGGRQATVPRALTESESRT